MFTSVGFSRSLFSYISSIICDTIVPKPLHDEFFTGSLLLRVKLFIATYIEKANKKIADFSVPGYLIGIRGG
jgi:hypothetical protein